MIVAWIVVAVIVIYIIFLFNRLLAMRNRIKEAFAAVDVYLQNRYDALVKVAEAVVAYAQHEQSMLKEITLIREGLDDQLMSEKMQTFDDLSDKLGSIR